MSRTDNDHVARDDRGGVQSNIGGREIHFLIIVQAEIDHPLDPKRGNGIAGLCIKRDETVTGRHVKNALVAPIAPIGDSMARKLAPSCSVCVHSTFPVAASSATTDRSDPAVVNRTPLTIKGVDSNRYSGSGPWGAVLNLQAI